MKKLLALLLAVTLVLSLAACGGDKGNDTVGQGTGDIADNATPAPDGTEDTGNPDATPEPEETATPESAATAEPSQTPEADGPSEPTATPEPAEPTATPKPEGPATPKPIQPRPSETPKPAETPEPQHKHSYTSKVTQEPTCGDGIKTFTCSCGDSYTEKIAGTGQHAWGEWIPMTLAYIDKAGTEDRICSACSARETKETYLCSVSNSFPNGIGLQFIRNCGGEINAAFMYAYACYEFGDFIEIPDKPAADFFDKLSKYFVVTDEIKNEIKTQFKASGDDEYGYHEDTDTFYLPYYSEDCDWDLMGYRHEDGKRYTTYYRSYVNSSSGDVEERYWEFELEFNRSNGQPNRYLSGREVDFIPSDIISW